MAGVKLRGRMGPCYAEILNGDALAFLAELHRGFDGKRRELLAARALRQEIDVVKREVGAAHYARGRFPEAIKLFRDLSLAADFVPFLTTPAYQLIL